MPVFEYRSDGMGGYSDIGSDDDEVDREAGGDADTLTGGKRKRRGGKGRKKIPIGMWALLTQAYTAIKRDWGHLPNLVNMLRC